MFFRQLRVGSDGRNFLMWKLRTMRNDCPGGPSITRAGDLRLTGIGIFLRRFKIDEFPQLVNVIGGEMSLVGSRPMLPPSRDPNPSLPARHNRGRLFGLSQRGKAIALSS